MGLTFAEFLPALYESLGGEEIPQGMSDSAPINLASTMPVRTGRPERQIDLEEAIAASQAMDDDDIGGEDDPLFAKAVAHVRKSGRASISSVQRALLIGYNRAARMIELMEDTGVITPMNTSGGREVIQ
jgi:DNA segregation ATPase FtsK/SpoIIIE-like protein